jgi:hypothetical protein
MTVVLWLVVAGFSWLVGFALQYIGESCYILKTHPSCDKKNCTRDQFYKIWAVFHEVATPHEKIHAERLIIIKEACGNACVSLIIAFVFAAVSFLPKGAAAWYPSLPIIVLSLVLALAFWRMHVIHVERYGKFVVNTNSHRKRPDLGGEIAAES